MTYKLRLINVLIKLRREISHLQYLANSCPLLSEERGLTEYDLMRLMDLEARLINKLNRLEKEGNK